MLPKGNYLAYQPLRPVNLQVGDFIEKRVDKYIAEGKAAKAAELKRLKEEGKSLMDMNKEIKVDTISTIIPIQQAANKLSKDAIDAKSYAMRIAENTAIPIETRREAYRIAEAKATNVLMLNKYLGSKEFVDGYTKKMSTNPSEIWEGDESLQFINALATGDHDVAFDNNTGSIVVAFPNQDQTSDQKVVWRDFTEVAMKTAQPYEKELSKEIEAFQKSQAANLFIKETDGRGGNRTTIQNKFLRDKAEKSFETTFGGFDVNSKNPMLKQFAYYVLGKRQIQSQEDWNTVRNAWVNKLEIYALKEFSVKDEKSALEIDNQKLQNTKLRQDIANPNRGGSQSNQEVVSPMLSNGNSIVQIRDDSGKVTGIQNWNINSISLPKLKGKPTSDNSFGVSSFRDSKGIQRDVWVMGAPAEDGKMVYSRINEKDLNEYVTKLGYNPIVVKQSLTSKQRALNRYSGQTQKGSIYDAVKINFKSNNIEDEDSNDATLSKLQNSIKYNK